ncbi:MAG: sulfatase-like hydrolase/transferase [Candidatus Aminicenantaceae bacterium]
MKKLIHISLAFLLCLIPSLIVEAHAEDFNVLLITIDTLRYDRISFHTDAHVRTPNIDKLAVRSKVFRRAYAHNPVTLPSHVNILTGTTPPYHGISDNPGFKLEDRFITLAEHLREAGYKTGAFIASFPLDSRFGLNQGFDLYNDNFGVQKLYQVYFAERRAPEVIRPAMEWIGTQTGKWFAWIHLFDPHEPYNPPAPYDQEYAGDLYSGEVAYTDSELAVLFDYLEQKGDMADTLIILTADHGEALGEHGEFSHSFFAYNPVMHVPLIVYIPGEEPGFVDENASHADIFPTVSDVLDLKVPKQIQGESLLPLAAGKARSKSMIYFESLTPYLSAGWAPLRGFIRGDLKYINLPIQEVYDLKRDMEENINLADKANLLQLEKDLKNLQKDLRGKTVGQKLDDVEQDTLNKMRSLGYVSVGSTQKQKQYTAKDDLKNLLPLQRKMIAASKSFRGQNPDQALKDLQEILSVRPDYLPAYNHMANLFYSTGDKDQAVETLRQGLKVNKKNMYLMSRLGLMLVEVQQYDEAISLLEACIKKENTNPDYFLYLGVAHQKSGRFDIALENYRKALQIDKSNAVVYNNIGSVHLMNFRSTRDMNQYRLAVANFNNALAFNPFLQAAINGKEAAEKLLKQLIN